MVVSRETGHEKINKNVKWVLNDYNYLAIGNSITKHGLCSYWWSNHGMAASRKDNDYYHLLKSFLRDHYGKVHSEICSFAVWEMQSYDREETYELLENYLSENLNLITLQLGENVHDLSTFEKDFDILIKHIKKRAPKAKLLVIGDFWTKENRDILKQKVAENNNVQFVSLEGIRDNKFYYCKKGSIVYDENEKQHTIEHDGVAKHPGDKGMRAIANRIIAVLSKR